MVKEGRRHMPTSEWVKLCVGHGMDGMMLAVGTRFLHDTGAIRFFGDAGALAGGGLNNDAAVGDDDDAGSVDDDDDACAGGRRGWR